MIDRLALYINEKALSCKNFIVAIDGRCASGKTTISSELAIKLNANLIHMDDFFLRPEQRTPQRLSIPGENIDHERFLTEVLEPLREGKPFTYRPFSCDTMTLGSPRDVQPLPISIVEGSYSCHTALREHYDLRIFMTVDPDEQMRRLTERNGAYAEVFRERWIPLEEAYFASCKVEEACHLTAKYAFSRLLTDDLTFSKIDP